MRYEYGDYEYIIFYQWISVLMVSQHLISKKSKFEFINLTCGPIFTMGSPIDTNQGQIMRQLHTNIGLEYFTCNVVFECREALTDPTICLRVTGNVKRKSILFAKCVSSSNKTEKAADDWHHYYCHMFITTEIESYICPYYSYIIIISGRV